MNNRKIEVWKPCPEFPFVEVSSFGDVRTLDKVVVSNGRGTYVKKRRILKQQRHDNGYLCVAFKVNGKTVTRYVHRLVAQTFIPNPDNLPEVNHKDNNPANNCVSNLEWCTHEYNIQYREKYGISAEKANGRPVLAVNLATLEVSQFHSRSEASRVLGVNIGNINSVIKGRHKQASGYWFAEDDGSGIEIDKDKLREIKAGMPYRGDIYAINLKTQEVSRFSSRIEADQKLGINQSNIVKVIKGKLKQTGGYWFTNADNNAVEATKAKFDDSVARKVKDLMTDKELQPA